MEDHEQDSHRGQEEDPSLEESAESLLTPSFRQVPWAALTSRIDAGSQGLTELANLLQDKRENDERSLMHFVKISKCNLFEHEIAASTSERTLGFFKNYHLFVVKALAQQSKDFSQTVVEELEEFRHQRAHVINKHKAAIQHCMAGIASAQEALLKAKKYYLKTKADYERSSMRLTNAEKAVEDYHKMMEEKKREGLVKENNSKWSRMLSAFETTPEQEREKQQKKADKRRDEMASAAEAIVDRRRALLHALAQHDAEIEKATEAFQRLETNRMLRLQEFMQKFCALERSVLDVRQQQLHIFEEAVNLQQPDEDIALFISQSKQSAESAHRFGGALSLLEEFNSMSLDSEDINLDLVDVQSVGRESVDDMVESPSELPITPPPSSFVLKKEDTTHVERQTVAHVQHTDDQNVEIHREMAALEKLIETFTQIFPTDDGKSAVSSQPVQVMSAEEWETVLNSKSLRHRFMQELDHQRGDNSLLDDSRYETLANAMQALLDICEDSDDNMMAASAMRMANMANTFYKKGPEENEKLYLQSDQRLLCHSIWRKHGFWEAALKESIFAHLNRHARDPWDDLEMEQLRDMVHDIHNAIFGHLGTLSFAMLQQGLTQEEVVDHISSMCRKFELSEDQEFDLIMSITGKKIKEYAPPTMLLGPTSFSTTVHHEPPATQQSPEEQPHARQSEHVRPQLKKVSSLFGKKFSGVFESSPSKHSHSSSSAHLDVSKSSQEEASSNKPNNDPPSSQTATASAEDDDDIAVL